MKCSHNCYVQRTVLYIHIYANHQGSQNDDNTRNNTVAKNKNRKEELPQWFKWFSQTLCQWDYMWVCQPSEIRVLDWGLGGRVCENGNHKSRNLDTATGLINTHKWWWFNVYKAPGINISYQLKYESTCTKLCVCVCAFCSEWKWKRTTPSSVHWTAANCHFSPPNRFSTTTTSITTTGSTCSVLYINTHRQRHSSVITWIERFQPTNQPTSERVSEWANKHSNTCN